MKKIFRLLFLLLKRTRVIIFLRKAKKKGKNIAIFFPITINNIKNLEIGNNCSIGTYTHMWIGDIGLYIGDNVMIAPHCCITTLGHDPSARDMTKTLIAKQIRIEDNVWIGCNVTVLPGVTIGEGSVIGAGSIVTKNIPPYSIAVGNPAIIIKQRQIIE
jgi:acetyltransferase-like isoleucine patch superfamily enzyme